MLKLYSEVFIKRLTLLFKILKANINIKLLIVNQTTVDKTYKTYKIIQNTHLEYNIELKIVYLS